MEVSWTMYTDNSDVEESISGTIRWAAKNEPELDYSALIDRVKESVVHDIEESLIYTSDIVESWECLGCPEPDCDMGSIVNNMIGAIVETLCYGDHEDEIRDGLITLAEEICDDAENSQWWDYVGQIDTWPNDLWEFITASPERRDDIVAAWNGAEMAE